MQNYWSPVLGVSCCDLSCNCSGNLPVCSVWYWEACVLYTAVTPMIFKAVRSALAVADDCCAEKKKGKKERVLALTNSTTSVPQQDMQLARLTLHCAENMSHAPGACLSQHYTDTQHTANPLQHQFHASPDLSSQYCCGGCRKASCSCCTTEPGSCSASCKAA
jgi:hypothetical protein